MSGRDRYRSGDDRREAERREAERREEERREADRRRGVRSEERIEIEPKRKRRSTATVERLKEPLRPSWGDTGELRLPLADEPSGVFHVEALASGESEVAPLVHKPSQVRPRTAAERWLRLIFGVSLLLAAGLTFGPAYVNATKRLSGGETYDDWRARTVRVESSPTGAKVYIGSALRGTTPLETVVKCRGRTISVRVERAGHEIWQWNGICSTSAMLRLRAALAPK
ncbi:MAG: PEGA domain-containing protein [Myxococcales bacterium]|nr:PEGA domain-containing protein [Myxococcales bacterium]